MKKIMMLIILVITVANCSLFDLKEWEEVEREDKERGRMCGYTKNGYTVCGNTR